MLFETRIKIHFDEADPAGIAFSGGLFHKMHRCYEEFVAALDQDPKAFFLDPQWIFPIRHVDAEYLAPLFPLETYKVTIAVARLSETSFQLQFRVLDDKGERARLLSTHVCVERATMKKAEIPASIKSNLKKFVNPE